MADGVKTTVAEVVEKAAENGDLTLQGELFDEADVAPVEALDAAEEALNRGRGRPKGAKNKKSAALREYLAARYGNPVCLLMARAVADVHAVASQLGADPIDIWKEQNDILKAVLPYVMEKMTPDQVQQNLISLSVSTAAFDREDEKSETIETADFRQISAKEIDDV